MSLSVRRGVKALVPPVPRFPAKQETRIEMANHKSAKKRIRQNAKRRVRNMHWRSTVRTFIKRVRLAVAEGNAEEAGTRLREAARMMQKASSKGVMHRNTVSRKISRLSTLVNSLTASDSEK